MARQTAACMMAMALWASGCTFQEERLECLYDCDLCDIETGCPPDRCGLLVVMRDDCTDEVETAEVAVDECLEDGELVPGKQMMLCASILKGQKSKVTIRGEHGADEASWIWPTTVECTTARAGHIVVLTLSCSER